jgi:hypothetical protein
MTALVLPDAQVVLHVSDAGDGFRHVLRPALLVAAAHGAHEGDLAVLYRHIDFRCVDHHVVREALCVSSRMRSSERW